MATMTADEASFFLPADTDTGILAEFIAEANEHLEASDPHLLTLESEPGNRELLDAVFRAFHSIKGVAGFLGLDGIKILSHEAGNQGLQPGRRPGHSARTRPDQTRIPGVIRRFTKRHIPLQKAAAHRSAPGAPRGTGLRPPPPDIMATRAEAASASPPANPPETRSSP